MMNNNVKFGSSINGQVITDMPIEMLRAMYETIGDAIANYDAEEKKRQEERKEELAMDIVVAIDAARDEGYTVFIDGWTMPPVDKPIDIGLVSDGEGWY